MPGAEHTRTWRRGRAGWRAGLVGEGDVAGGLGLGVKGVILGRGCGLGHLHTHHNNLDEAQEPTDGSERGAAAGLAKGLSDQSDMPASLWQISGVEGKGTRRNTQEENDESSESSQPAQPQQYQALLALLVACVTARSVSGQRGRVDSSLR